MESPYCEVERIDLEALDLGCLHIDYSKEALRETVNDVLEKLGFSHSEQFFSMIEEPFESSEEANYFDLF
jgi:hypothetical protein